MSWKFSFYPGSSFPRSQGLLKLVHEFIFEYQPMSVSEAGARWAPQWLSSANHVAGLHYHFSHSHDPGLWTVRSWQPCWSWASSSGRVWPAAGWLLLTICPALYLITSADAASSPRLRVRAFSSQIHVQLGVSYSKTAWEANFTVFSAAQGTFSIPGHSIFSRTFPNTVRRGQVVTGSSINKAKKCKEPVSLSLACSWFPLSLKEFFLSVLWFSFPLMWSSLELLALRCVLVSFHHKEKTSVAGSLCSHMSLLLSGTYLCETRGKCWVGGPFAMCTDSS